MKDLNEFRVINETEKKYIQESVSPKILETLNKSGKIVYISLKNQDSNKAFPELYLISKELTDVLGSIRNKNSISSAGIYFGFIKKGKFYLSLEGTEILISENYFQEEIYLIVSKSGEKSILYGNEITKEMVVKVNQALKTQDLLLVLNESREFIALARSHVDYFTFQNLKKIDVIATNLVDKGSYLRKKQ